MLYRFQIDLSDVDRNIYQILDFRVALHPSESSSYLLTRVLAYVLNYQSNLEFSPNGLGDSDLPAMLAYGNHGAIDLWVEIGNPSSRRLHKATKSANKVVIYTYKSPEVLITEVKSNQVHRVSEIEIYAFEASFLKELEGQLEKNNKWTILHQQGHLDIDTGSTLISTNLSSRNFN